MRSATSAPGRTTAHHRRAPPPPTRCRSPRLLLRSQRQNTTASHGDPYSFRDRDSARRLCFGHPVAPATRTVDPLPGAVVGRALPEPASALPAEARRILTSPDPRETALLCVRYALDKKAYDLL